MTDEIEKVGIVQPGSKIRNIAVERSDYGNGFTISVDMERWTSIQILENYRDLIGLTNGDRATFVVKQLRGLADRIEKHCVYKVLGKEQPF